MNNLLLGGIVALFSLKHLFIIFVLLIIPILWVFNIKKDYKILKISIYLLLLLELIRVMFLLIFDNFDISKDLSLQLCFTYIIVGFIYLKTKKEYLLSYLGSFGVIFGFTSIVFRDPNPFLSFDNIECYGYHGILFFIGLYIIKNYKIIFNFKCIIIIWLQIIAGLLANYLIGHGSNYAFLNSFIFPGKEFHYNIEIFKIPFNGYSINDLLIFLLNNIGYFYYFILLIITATLLSSLWLYFISKCSCLLQKHRV